MNNLLRRPGPMLMAGGENQGTALKSSMQRVYEESIRLHRRNGHAPTLRRPDTTPLLQAHPRLGVKQMNRARVRRHPDAFAWPRGDSLAEDADDLLAAEFGEHLRL
jgi:hypothetical protein